MSHDGSNIIERKQWQGVKLTPALVQLCRDAQNVAVSPPRSGNESSIMAQDKLISSDKKEYLSVDTLQALETILSFVNRSHELEEALRHTSLHFSKPAPPRPSEDAAKFKQRLARLKLKQEESRYANLTSNLGKAPQADDHVTTKSMTYAASIGLNMIVAPLSFGCLMYFFGGTLLDYLWPVDTTRYSHGMDIRKVIMGVVSGVLMLFIEMILFVIRTNELDKAVRKKERKSKKSPFSVYQADSVKTYTGGNRVQ